MANKRIYPGLPINFGLGFKVFSDGTEAHDAFMAKSDNCMLNVTANDVSDIRMIDHYIVIFWEDMAKYPVYLINKPLFGFLDKLYLRKVLDRIGPLKSENP